MFQTKIRHIDLKDMITLLTTLISVIGTPIGAYALYRLKSKGDQNALLKLQDKIQFCREHNIDIHEFLSEQYQVKTFAQEFGFEIVFNKLKSYISLYRRCNISPKSFRALHKRSLIKYNEETNEASLEITKLNKISYKGTWFFISLFLAIAFIGFYLSQRAMEFTNDRQINLICLSLLIFISIGFYFSSVYQLIQFVLPYQEAKRLIKKLKKD